MIIITRPGAVFGALLAVASFTHAEEKTNHLSVLDALSYRSAFADSEKQHAAFMLCNAPQRMSCEDAASELSRRFSSDVCKELYFIALVNGYGSGYDVLQKPFKVVFAIKKAKGVWPILISTPDDDTGLVSCIDTARAAAG